MSGDQGQNLEQTPAADAKGQRRTGDRAGVALGIAAAAPVGICALAAGGMLLAGDQRVLAMEMALPGVVLLTGLVVSAVPAVALIARRRRARRMTQTEKAVAEAATSAAADAMRTERAHHQRFLARLDHELKNPLTAIRVTAGAAQSGGVDDDAWRTVDAQAARLSTLVRDLRKLAELETRPLDLETVDLESLIRESIDALGGLRADAAGRISLTVTRVPWPVPPLSVDLDLLSLAIDNVIGNAVKYSTSGPIEVRVREESGYAVIDVADAGRGVPVADLPTVFDELARAGNARDVSGSGIGLTLVATVMRRHGGDVSLRSVEGAGTVVTLRLPIRR